VFDVAVGERRDLRTWPIKMMGAIQPFISGAISKDREHAGRGVPTDIAARPHTGGRLGIKGARESTATVQRRPGVRTDAQQGASVPVDADAAIQKRGRGDSPRRRAAAIACA